MSLAIEVELLCGWYGATHYNDREVPEWPPHPHRLFCALVAVWADEMDPGERRALDWLGGQAAPEVWCSQATPRSPYTTFVPVNDASIGRDLSGNYERQMEARAALASALQAGDAKAADRARKQVDKADAKAVQDAQGAFGLRRTESSATIAAGLSLLPESRLRQGRSFPVVVPDEPRVRFVWPEAEAEPSVVDQLDDLCRRVHRLGHASTLVACRVGRDADSQGEAGSQGDVASEDGLLRLRPDAAGELSLRVPGADSLKELVEAFRRHEGVQPRIMPARSQPYALVQRERAVPASALGGDWIAFNLSVPASGAPGRSGRSAAGLPLTRAAELSAAVRGALLHHAAHPPCELISGHAPARAPGEATPPSQQHHLAVVALPFVGDRYADGIIKGFAVVVPTAVATEQRNELLAALDAWERATGESAVGEVAASLRLRLPGGLALTATRASEDWGLVTLSASRWAGPAREWVTVTPVALDRNPGDLRAARPGRRAAAEAEAKATIVAACRRIGLPEPSTVVVDFEAMVRAVPPARRFPPFPSGREDKSGVRRVLVHVGLTFTEPVRGPVVLGAGRYRGLGLCLPLGAPGVGAARLVRQGREASHVA
jgi:CRISPR-associated protein Csb2